MKREVGYPVLDMITFPGIIGHDRPIAVLKRALANHTVAHAYMFSGESGVGKKLTAVMFAAAVNCPQAGPEGGCGECPSCRKIAAGGHPDVHIISGAGEEIKIDQVRQIQADLALKPFEGSKKVLIIDGAETMNTAAANAFLKTLEEPPGDALIILVTAMPQSLLPTIRSRCQEIRFLPLSRKKLASALAERRSLSEEDSWFLAALAQGSMGRALEMDKDGEKAAREEVRQLRDRLAGMNPGEVLTQAEALAKDRERFERAIEIGIEQLRDMLVLSITGEEKLLVDGQGAEFHRERAALYSHQQMLRDIDLLTAGKALLERRVSAQLVAEHLLLTLSGR